MTPSEFLAQVIDPALARLRSLGGPAVTPGAQIFLLAVALQESGGLKHRAQVLANGKAGPARGWFQFERGGVKAVMLHPASSRLLRVSCEDCDVPWDAEAIWRVIEGHDALAVMLARLLLWTDPGPLPVTEKEGWEAYAHRLWRPGKPHYGTWPGNWVVASATVATAGADPAKAT